MTEVRLRLTGKAAKGRDIYRAIREKVNQCRAMGIEPKKIWAGKDTIDAIHALWFAVAQKYDMRIPPGVANVPMAQGMGMGRADFLFEYDEDPEKAHTLRRKPVANPLPDND